LRSLSSPHRSNTRRLSRLAPSIPAFFSPLSSSLSSSPLSFTFVPPNVLTSHLRALSVMLMFSLKIVWFALSLSGVLACWAALGSFVHATNSLWIPLVYCFANTVLQSVFCLGLIWRLDPSLMPHVFTIAQTILIQTSWTCIASLSAILTVTTATKIVHRFEWASRLFTSPLFCGLFVVIACSGELAAQSVVLEKFNVPQSANGMVGDTSNPPWIRLLGYAGANLFLVIPSLIISVLIIGHIVCFKRHTDDTHGILQDDGLTRVPSRPSKRASLQGRRTPSLSDIPHASVGSIPRATPTPSTRSVNAITTRTDSPTLTILSPPGRAKTIVSRSRYHLPYDWTKTGSLENLSVMQGSETKSALSPEPRPSFTSERSVRSAIAFTSLTTTPSPRESPTIHSRVTSPLSPSYRPDGKYSPDAHAWILRGGEIHLPSDDAVSGPLRWARSSTASPDALSTKSELEFASFYDHIELRSHPPCARSSESHDTEAYCIPRPSPPYFMVSTWRVLFFLLFISVTQLLAAMSSLIDAISRHSTSIPFGSQDVARLLVAWGPCILFGISFLPRWNRR